MALDFGIFDHMERELGVELDEMYEHRLLFLEAADRLGYYGYHLSEHHQTPLCVAPSQNVFLAAAGQRTRRIKLGGLVYLLPFYHPLRLIEEVCTVDHLTGGRLQLGVGRGISPMEHDFWGLPPAEAHARFEETLTVLRKGLTNEWLSHEGEYYRFDRVPMELTPKQRPYPPFWYAGNWQHAARHGMNFIGSNSLRRLPETVQNFTALYQQTRERGETANPPTSEPFIGTARHIYVDDSDEKAERRARHAWKTYHLNYAKRGDPPPVGGPSFGGDFDAGLKTESVIVGSPATIRSYIERYAATGANYCVLAFQWGDLTHDEMLSSLTLFGEEVMGKVFPPAMAAG